MVAFRDIDSSLHSDREIQLAAAAANMHFLRADADDRMRADRELVLLGVAKDGAMLRFASPQLQDDIDVVRVSLRAPLGKENGGSGYNFASERLRSNREIALEAIETAPSEVYCLPESLLKDKSFALDLASRCKVKPNCTFGCPLRCCPDMQSDPDVRARHGPSSLWQWELCTAAFDTKAK